MSPRGPREHYIYALVSEEEHALIRQRAAAAGLSLSNYVRRALNGMVLDEDPHAILLEERHSGDSQRRPHVQEA
jgi:hypothetical protein